MRTNTNRRVPARIARRSAIAMAMGVTLSSSAFATTVGNGWFTGYTYNDLGYASYATDQSSCSANQGNDVPLSPSYEPSVWQSPENGYLGDPYSGTPWESNSPIYSPYVPFDGQPNPFFDLSPTSGDPYGGSTGSPSGDSPDPAYNYIPPVAPDPFVTNNYDYSAPVASDGFDSNSYNSDSFDLVGNPLNAAVGNKIEVGRDFLGRGPFPIVFVRSYNSLPPTVSGGINSLGGNWRHNYDMTISAQGNDVYLFRADGRVAKFSLVGGVYQSADDRISTLAQQSPSPSQPWAAWAVTNADRSVETYDANGRLRSIVNRNGAAQSLAYDANGRLASIADQFGRALGLAYDVSGRLATLTSPDGGVVSYSYDSNNNLTGVRYPDGTSVGYLYQSAYHPTLLTSKVDGKGVTVASWTYAPNGQALAGQLYGGVAGASVVYGGTSSSVTDAAGVVRTRQYVRTASNELRISSVSVSCSDCETGLTRSVAYDGNGFVASQTDFMGRTVQYTRDSTGLVLTKTVGAGTSLAQTTSYTWNSTFHKPLSITLPNGTVASFSYDAKGNLIARTVTVNAGTSNPQSRTTTYGYNALGQVTTVTDPRSDTTTLTYDNQGNVATVTNPLNQTIHVTQYDAVGRPLQVQDANGQTYTATYDSMGRLASNTTGSVTTVQRTTTYGYDAAGLLQTVRPPNGNVVTYAYDGAHRLTDIADGAGRSLHRVLDAAGRTTRVEARSAAGTVIRSANYSYDSRGRLKSVVGNNGQQRTYSYDRGYSVVATTDALGHQTQVSYDALGRIVQRTDANGGITQYAYDANGQVSTVVTPRGLTTQYVHDGFGEVTGVSSPEAGASSFSYDMAGDPTSVVDARGKTTAVQFDATNRPTKITYADASAVSLSYDQGTNGVGRLTGVSGADASYLFGYDIDGALISSELIFSGWFKATTNYFYNNGHQVSSIAYPRSGAIQLAYAPDGHLASMTWGKTTIASGLTYDPDGKLAGWTWGNGQAVARTYDADGRLTGYTKGVSTGSLAYDTANRIQSQADSRGSNYLQGYSYDSLDRLTGWSLNGTALGYAYDFDSNRTVGPSATYSYGSTSNRLLVVAGGPPYPTNLQQYDAAGNVVSDAASTYSYDSRGRMTDSSNSTSSTHYLIDPFGRRVGKITPATATSTYFVYDRRGHLLGEYDGGVSGAYSEYIWVDDLPVAMIRSPSWTMSPTLYYIHADQLGTPRQVTQPLAGSTMKLVWEWVGEPFGNSYPNEDPTGSGTRFTLNMRHAGQYYDQETGLFNNGFRDYSPALGRYMQSDPIGLAGGINTYAYVGGNPISMIDPNGKLFGVDDATIGTVVTGAAIVGGGSAFVGTLIGGGSLGQAFASIPSGAIGGVTTAILATAGATTVLTAIAYEGLAFTVNAALDAWAISDLTGSMPAPRSQTCP